MFENLLVNGHAIAELNKGRCRRRHRLNLREHGGLAELGRPLARRRHGLRWLLARKGSGRVNVEDGREREEEQKKREGKPPCESDVDLLLL